MYTPQKTVISTNSAEILNTIANEIGGEFRDAVPLVESLDDIKEYGNVVMGGGWFRNAFVAMLNKIAQTILTYRTYENQLRLFKGGRRHRKYLGKSDNARGLYSVSRKPRRRVPDKESGY